MSPMPQYSQAAIPHSRRGGPMRRLAVFPVIGLAVFLVTLVRADSGPAEKSDVPALKVDAVAGLVTGETKDFAAERKDMPTIYVFVQADKFDRPLARFLKVLDQELGKDRPDVQVIA